MEDSENINKYLLDEWEICEIVEGWGMVSKSLEKRLEEWKISETIEIIDTTALLRLGRIPRRVLKIWDDIKTDYRERPINDTGVKNTQSL